MAGPDDAPPAINDAQLRRLARHLAGAEQAVRERDLRRSAQPVAFGLAAALALAATGLLLPWSRADGISGDAFAHSAGLPAIFLLTAAGTGVALVLYLAAPGTGAASAVQAVGLTGGAITIIAALVVNGGVGAPHRQWWGPGLFAAAMVAATLLAGSFSHPSDPDTRIVGYTGPPSSLPEIREQLRESLVAVLAARPRPRLISTGLAGLGVSGLGLAAVGLTASWQRLTGQVVTRIADHPLVWRGTELTATHALRWAIAAGLAACLLAAFIRPMRRLLPLLLTAAGAVVVALTLSATAGIPVRGTSSAISVGSGAWLTLAGGIVAATCGLVLGAEQVRAAGRPGRARAVAVAAVFAVLVGGLDGYLGQRPAGADDNGRGAPVLGAASEPDDRLGGPAVASAFDTVELSSTGIPDPPVVTRSFDGRPRTWFVRPQGRDTFLIEEIVRGRALPVTVVSGADDIDLIGVTGDHAIVAGYSTYESVVDVVDLHDPSNGIADSYDSGAPPVTVLTNRTDRAGVRPGSVSAKHLRVQLLADGSAIVLAEPEQGGIHAYRVDARTVRDVRPWTLIPLPDPPVRNSVYGIDGSDYSVAPYESPGGVVRTVPDGRVRPVLGTVSDKRCALSRDPLSSSLDHYQVPGSTGLAAVDRAGNLWLATGRDTEHGDSDLYVVTADGVLRKMPAAWHGTAVLRIVGDGSLFVTIPDRAHDTNPTYRMADPPTAARSAAALPPVAAGCVSDNRVTVPTAGRRATPVGTAARPGSDLDDQAVTVDATATTIQADVVRSATPNAAGDYPGRWNLVRIAPGRPASTVYSTSTADIEAVEPDGRGGAWWLELDQPKSTSDDQGPGSIGHIDAAGHARIVGRHVVPTTNDRQAEARLAPDPHDGTVWWNFGYTAWQRTTPDGRTSLLAYAGDTPTFGGGVGFAGGPDTVERIVAPDTRSVVLGSHSGRDLYLPSALASHAASGDFAVAGYLATTSDGRLLLYQASYLARRAPNGKFEVLAGPKDALPGEDQLESLVVVADQLVITTRTDRVYKVDVS